MFLAMSWRFDIGEQNDLVESYEADLMLMSESYSIVFNGVTLGGESLKTASTGELIAQVYVQLVYPSLSLSLIKFKEVK